MKNLDKKVLAMGVGAGVGAITPTLLKNYVETSQGQMIPGLDALGIWGTWHVFVPLVSGGVLIALSQFTNMIRNDTLNGALAMYGFAALFSAVVAGATETYTPAGLRARGLYFGSGV